MSKKISNPPPPVGIVKPPPPPNPPTRSNPAVSEKRILELTLDELREYAHGRLVLSSEKRARK